MPTTKNTSKESNQAGVSVIFTISYQSMPGKLTPSRMPMVKSEIIRPIKVAMPTMISRIPINFPNTLNRNRIISPTVSKKGFSPFLYFVAHRVVIHTADPIGDIIKTLFYLFFNIAKVYRFSPHIEFLGGGLPLREPESTTGCTRLLRSRCRILQG